MGNMDRLPRQAIVVVYVRHKAKCKHREDEFSPRCTCPKSLRWSQKGKQYRVTARTRTWGVAEERARELQKKLDAGESTAAVLPEEGKQPTIAQAVETHITAKEGEGVSPATIRKLRYQLGLFEQFMASRSKFFPVDITPTDVIEFRASWMSWSSAVTRQKAQGNLRGFLKACCKGNLPELLRSLKAIKKSRQDKERLAPKPFSEDEIARLLAQVPVTFPDAAKAAKVTALIHCMVSTGLAIRDTVQLERANLADGWLRIDRQKTGKRVAQKLDGALLEELLSTANGNPQYIFWDGKSQATSATNLWQITLRSVMRDAGLWIKGNLSHRFRDTAVDYWLGEGYSLTDIAAMLGDTVAVVEEHYKDRASKRMEERLEKLPVRSWGAQ
jgi:integrase